MDNYPGAINDIKLALSGLSGTLPRRAVLLPDGTVGDRLARPDLLEVVPISIVCEILRRSTGEHVHSRHTPHLLRECLETNRPGSWRALLDDVTTGDLDFGAVAAAWALEDHSARLVQCLVNTASGTHMWLVICAMQHILQCVDPSATYHTGLAFQKAFPDLLRAISRRMRNMSADMRAGAIAALGKIVVWCDIPEATLCAMLEAVLDGSPEDMLHLFLFAPIQQLAQESPPLVEKLLHKAEQAAQASRYPACALLALLSQDQLRPFEERVLALVQRSLDTAAAQGSIDSKLALVCGVLAKSVCPPRSLQSSLAHALCCMSLN